MIWAILAVVVVVLVAVIEKQAPPCPKCGAPIVRRQARSESGAGRMFWGYSTFPKCRGRVQDSQEPVPGVIT